MKRSMKLKDDFLIIDLDAEAYDDLEFDLDKLSEDLLEFDLDELTEDLFKFDLDAEGSGDLKSINLDEPGSSAADMSSVPAKKIKMFVSAFTTLAMIGIVASVCYITVPLLDEYSSEKKVQKLRHERLSVMEDDAVNEDIPVVSENIDNPYVDIFSQNEDMAAWLVVEDTMIDYPVMQTMEDEEYYLHRDFYGEPDNSGCLLLDTDSSLDESSATSNLIIHGHNMKIGTMFGDLDLYKESDYWQEHQYVKLYTKNELREYQVIAVFYSQVYYPEDHVFKYYKFFQADTEESFDDFYLNIKSLSLYDTGVEAQLGDQFLTLSTCAYHVEEGRFVVVCKEYARSQQFQVSHL